MYRDHCNIWPLGFDRVPSGQPWITAAVEDSARAYDAVKHHTWYRNLEPTLDDLAAHAENGQIIVDYSGGTGIFTEQFLERNPDREIGLLLVDASPKFLRLALEKLRGDVRTAFRHLPYLKDERRMMQLDEIISAELRRRGLDGLCCTNAVHLYPNLRPTFNAWSSLIRRGGFVLLQSGNIDNPDAPVGSWFIDRTVERVQPVARELVAADPDYSIFRDDLDNQTRNETYDQLRHAYFLPMRPLETYLHTLNEAELEVQHVTTQPVEAIVSEWSDFLGAYHEGVLGWAGGCKRIDGTDPPPDVIALRKKLLAAAMAELFNDRARFQACWTHIRCRRA